MRLRDGLEPPVARAAGSWPASARKANHGRQNGHTVSDNVVTEYWGCGMGH